MLSAMDLYRTGRGGGASAGSGDISPTAPSSVGGGLGNTVGMIKRFEFGTAESLGSFTAP